jgi:subtilisin-like proprotein convertase family protein
MRARCLLLTALGLALAIGPQPAAGALYSSGPVAIGDSFATPAPASPYPATLNVAAEQIVTDVQVRFRNFTHSFPSDVDALLVGPQGQRVLLMSDAGGSEPVVDRDLTFSGSAAEPVPEPIVSGRFRPTDVNEESDDPDLFPSPAPSGPFGGSLSDFNAPDSRGVWSLYVVDDTEEDGGDIESWSLDFSTRRGARTSVGALTSGRENAGPARVLIRRSPPGSGDPLRAARVSYSTGPAPSGSAATPGQDFTAVSGAVDFAAGETEKAVEIPILDDPFHEPSERFELRLTSASGDSEISSYAAAETVSISSDDPPPAAPRLSAAAVQRVLKQRGVVVSARSNFSGAVVATGSIALPRGIAKLVRLKAARGTLTAGARRRLKLGLRPQGVRSLRRAFSRKRTLTAIVRVVATAPSGKKLATTTRIKLKR